MNKLVTAALLGAACTLAACGDSYDDEDAATEAYDEETADADYTPPAAETPAPEPTATPEPDPTGTAEPEPAATGSDDY